MKNWGNVADHVSISPGVIRISQISYPSQFTSKTCYSLILGQPKHMCTIHHTHQVTSSKKQNGWIWDKDYVDPFTPVKLSHGSETLQSKSPYGPLRKTQPVNSNNSTLGMWETYVSSEKWNMQKSKTATAKINRWERRQGSPLDLELLRC